MRTASAVRQLSRLGCCGASRVTAGCLGDAQTVMVQKRGFWALRLMRGVHDVVGHALTLGEYASGVRSPQAAASSSISSREATCENTWVQSLVDHLLTA